MADPKPNNYICRKNPKYTNPKCHWCIYSQGCEGELVALKDFYRFATCPDRLDIDNNKPYCNTHAECKYCKDYQLCSKGIFKS